MKLERLRDAAPGAPHKLRTTSPAFALQRAAGNRATTQLLQRDASKTARLAKIAKQLQLGVEERDIHLAMRVKEGEDHGVRPGLNVVAHLEARGRTGFVDSSGRYHGDFLTATRDGELPAVAIMIGPLAFQEGDDSVLATLRHELTHAEHDRMVLGWVQKWRVSGKGDFLAWMRRQKLSAADLALVGSGTLGKWYDTELLAHIEGFAAVFDRTPPPATTVLLKSALPTAIEELRGAAERGWVGVDDAIKIAAEKRLAAIYSGLDASRQALLPRLAVLSPLPRHHTLAQGCEGRRREGRQPGVGRLPPLPRLSRVDARRRRERRARRPSAPALGQRAVRRRDQAPCARPDREGQRRQGHRLLRRRLPVRRRVTLARRLAQLRGA